MTEKTLRLTSKREAILHTKRVSKLRADLIKQFGKDEIDNIERIVAAQADTLLAQGGGYQSTLETLSKQFLAFSSPFGPPPVSPPYSSYPDKPRFTQATPQPQTKHLLVPQAGFPSETLTNAPPKSPNQIRQIPVRPKLGIMNEWAAVAIRKDELDRLEKQQEVQAERQKRDLYREELDAQKRLVTIRRQVFREKEADQERDRLARLDDVVKEEAGIEKEGIELAKRVHKQCVGDSLQDKRLKEAARVAGVEKERRVFNESVERSIREEEEMEKTKEQHKKQVTETLKQIYEQQAETKKRVKETVRREEQAQANWYAKQEADLEREELQYKAQEDRRIQKKYEEGLRQQLEYTQGRKKQQQLMTDHERRLNRNMIESYMLSDVAQAIPDAYTYSKNRVPSRNLRDQPEQQKEFLIKDLDYFNRLISSKEKPVAGQSPIDTFAVPEGQTRRHYKNSFNNNGTMMMMKLPEESTKTVDARTSSSIVLPGTKEKREDDPFEFAHPVVDHKFYKNRILSKRSHVF